MADQPSNLPTRKVGSGALAGALTVIAAWGVEAFTDTEIPAAVASAITVILMFIVSYWVPESDAPDDEGLEP